MRKAFRDDIYGQSLYLSINGNLTEKIANDKGMIGQIAYEIFQTESDGVLSVTIRLTPKSDISPDYLGFRLGIDCFMETYPGWNDKHFPTALRCENNGFWGMFMSPLHDIIAVCSNSRIVSWRNEYNVLHNDVGHRIYTSSIDFVNIYSQPARHIESPSVLKQGNTYEYVIHYKSVSSVDEGYSFIKDHSGIEVITPSKHTVEIDEKFEYNGTLISFDSFGRKLINLPDKAEASVYVRRPWSHYLKAANESAYYCQQKAGTHTESWYGYFTRVLYVKNFGSKDDLKELTTDFDAFFNIITKGNPRRMVFKTHPYRLQNCSGLISLLADFYELTKDDKYLDYAGDLAKWLMKLQSSDGSFRSHGVHYTCVIYPAKSMLELSVAESESGRKEAGKMHFECAKRAIEELCRSMENIDTEGEMTFEDGMISCEALQIAYLAVLTDSEADRTRYLAAAEEIFYKHKCLEQRVIPDCRSRGATLRFWEARYDLNFKKSMFNSPHGWTSWKNYASYYLYILTGNIEYLRDLMDTLGACMQCVGEDGVLNWGFVIDPCIVGNQMVPSNNKYGFTFKNVVVGEEHLPMISSWYRQRQKDLPDQYLLSFDENKYKMQKLGGSCDNDVHEHFKCLGETVWGKAFIHEKTIGVYETYNCKISGDGFISEDVNVKKFIIFSLENKEMLISGKSFNIVKGMNFVAI